MTKHPLIDLDIEAEGIGKWVEPGDVDGWTDAIQFFEDHPNEVLIMGHKARSLVNQGMNSVSFANQVMDIFDNVLQTFKKRVHPNFTEKPKMYTISYIHPTKSKSHEPGKVAAPASMSKTQKSGY
jgi:hypothetical protein